MDFGCKEAHGAAEIVVSGPISRKLYSVAPPSSPWFPGPRDTRIPKCPTEITEFYCFNFRDLTTSRALLYGVSDGWIFSAAVPQLVPHFGWGVLAILKRRNFRFRYRNLFAHGVWPHVSMLGNSKLRKKRNFGHFYTIPNNFFSISQPAKWFNFIF